MCVFSNKLALESHGSGLKEVMTTIYAFLSVVKMDHVYYRAIRARTLLKIAL